MKWYKNIRLGDPSIICDHLFFLWSFSETIQAYLVANEGRIVGKPCILSLRLAMSKTRIYEPSILLGHRENIYGIQHLIPEVCNIREKGEITIYMNPSSNFKPNVNGQNNQTWISWVQKVTLQKLDLWCITLCMILFAFVPQATRISWWWS